jgi:hypothetical protein
LLILLHVILSASMNCGRARMLGRLVLNWLKLHVDFIRLLLLKRRHCVLTLTRRFFAVGGDSVLRVVVVWFFGLDLVDDDLDHFI